MCGGRPGDYGSLQLYRDMLEEAHAEFGTWERVRPGEPPPGTGIQVRHREFIRRRLQDPELAARLRELRGEEPAHDPDDDLPVGAGVREPRRTRAARASTGVAQGRLID